MSALTASGPHDKRYLKYAFSEPFSFLRPAKSTSNSMVFQRWQCYNGSRTPPCNLPNLGLSWPTNLFFGTLLKVTIHRVAESFGTKSTFELLIHIKAKDVAAMVADFWLYDLWNGRHTHRVNCPANLIGSPLEWCGEPSLIWGNFSGRSVNTLWFTGNPITKRFPAELEECARVGGKKPWWIWERKTLAWENFC